jgi:hypothetical protein
MGPRRLHLHISPPICNNHLKSIGVYILEPQPSQSETVYSALLCISKISSLRHLRVETDPNPRKLFSEQLRSLQHLSPQDLD